MRGHYGQTKCAATNQLSGRGIVVWIRSFIEPDLFDNNVPFDNTTPIYLINLLWKLELGLRLDLQLHYFRIFRGE